MRPGRVGGEGRRELDRLTAVVEAEWARVREAVGREELALLRALLTRMSAQLT
ncbi:hypothetical protein AB0C84_02060 [Actinomadura sp. NPDC048955]|uniref:hypothetical protein n=1 Tax=Actinomadura sp. NPDC048955 TaxID=3158228 RepID=UPI0033C93225